MDDERLERRKTVTLTNEQIEEIANLAAEKTVVMMQSQVYQYVGKRFIEKLAYFVGLVVVGIMLYLHDKGYLKHLL